MYIAKNNDGSVVLYHKKPKEKNGYYLSVDGKYFNIDPKYYPHKEDKGPIEVDIFIKEKI